MITRSILFPSMAAPAPLICSLLRTLLRIIYSAVRSKQLFRCHIGFQKDGVMSFRFPMISTALPGCTIRTTYTLAGSMACRGWGCAVKERIGDCQSIFGWHAAHEADLFSCTNSSHLR